MSLELLRIFEDTPNTPIQHAYPLKADGPKHQTSIQNKHRYFRSLVDNSPSCCKYAIERLETIVNIKSAEYLLEQRKQILKSKPLSIGNLFMKLPVMLFEHSNDDRYDQLRCCYDAALDEAISELVDLFKLVDADQSKLPSVVPEYTYYPPPNRRESTSTSASISSSVLQTGCSVEDCGLYSQMEGAAKVSITGVISAQSSNYRRSLIQLTRDKFQVFRFRTNGQLKLIAAAKLDTLSVRPTSDTIELISAQPLLNGKFKRGYKISLKFKHKEIYDEWVRNLIKNAKFAFEYLLCGQQVIDNIPSGASLLAELHRIKRHQNCSCGAEWPAWADLRTFKLICTDCAGFERSKSDAIVRSVLMDSSCWTSIVLKKLRERG